MKLTEREEQLLKAAARGLTDREISNELFISRDTVSSYWRRILLKYGASSRTECVAHYSKAQANTLVVEHEQKHERLINEIREREEVHIRTDAERRMLSAITEASLSYINGEHELKESLDRLLTDVLELTDSQYGFMGEVLYEDGKPYLLEHALTNIAWDEPTRELYRVHHETGLKFTNLNTLFGHVMVTGEVVLTNDASKDPRAGGTPHGHPTLESFLGLPVFHGGELVGMIGLANCPGGYSAEDVDYLKPLVITCANYIVGWRNKQEKRAMQRKVANTELLVRNLVDRIASGILYETPERTVQFVNQSFLSLFGICASADDLVGVSCQVCAEQAKDAFIGSDQFIERIDAIIEAGENVRNELLVAKDGRRIERDFYVMKDEGVVLGYIWCFREIA